MEMNEKHIKEKLKKIEEQLVAIDITLINYDYYDKLLEMHKKLWDLLYFKLNQEENFLVK